MNSYIVSYPYNFQILDEKNPNKDNIDFEKMINEYNNFINILINQQVNLKFINFSKSKSQVFTRDIGFFIGGILFVSNLKDENRKDEINPLLKFIEEHKIQYYTMKNNIEGGDVILYDNYIFIGLSDRTSKEGIEEVQKVLIEKNIDMKVIPINFNKEKLHLDCVFNVLREGEGVTSDYVYDNHILNRYVKKLYKIGKPLSDKLATNFVKLKDGTIITGVLEMAEFLEGKGYRTIYCPYEEIEKAGGSLGCSTLPIGEI